MKKIQELKDFPFPKITAVDLAFPTFDTHPELLRMALNEDVTKGVEKFNQLFFKGGEIKLQPDVVEGSWKWDAWLYAKAFMRSWSPKHEHKTIICGLIFQECLILE